MAAGERPRAQPSHDARRDTETLENLLALYLGRVDEGDGVDPDQIREAHPVLADEILRGLETFAQMENPGDTNNAPPLGTLGDYTLRRQIGRGGMGVVYEAWQGSVERPVALKVLPAGFAADNKAFMRFMREAKTAAQLSHPNVVGVHGMGVEENTPYYAMEYVEGETLAQVLGRLKEAKDTDETPFGVPTEQQFYLNLAKAFADVADGLQHAHSKGVIHRDIKPSNLILDAEDRLRILDFGLARLEGQESLTISGDVVGTPAYMSPEQAKRRKTPVDHRTDIYSLGATLYELLTHQQPFRGKDHNDTLSQIIERDPRPPSAWNRHIPEDLETVILKCLRKDAGERYGTAEALGQDLRRFVRGNAVEAKPEKTWERLSRRCWNNRRALTVCGILGVLSALVGFLGLDVHETRRDRRFGDYEKKVDTGLMRVLLTRSILKTAQETLVDDGGQLERSERLFELFPRSRRHRLEQVLDDFEEAASLLPGRPEASYHQARACLLLERREEARTALEKALAADPVFVPARRVLSSYSTESRPPTRSPGPAPTWAPFWLRAFEAEQDIDGHEALSAYDGLIQLQRSGQALYVGGAVDARVGRALTRLELGETGAAIADLASIREDWPDLMEPVLLLGKAWYLHGDTEEADRVFTAFLESARFPSDDVCFWIAIILRSLKGTMEGYDWAKSGLDWAEKIRDAALRARLRVGFLYEMRYFEAAAIAGREAVRLNPADDHALTWLACSLYFLHAPAEEIESLARRIIELDPESGAGYEVLGMALRRQKKFEEALAAMDRAVELLPHLWSARNGRGHTLLKLGRLKEAERDIRHALTLGTAGLIWDSLGYVLKEQGGREDEELAAFLNANRLDPRLPSPHRELARLFEQQGQLERALSSYDSFLELRPDDAKARSLREQTLEALSTDKLSPTRTQKSGN